MALELGKPDEAIQDFSQAVELQPTAEGYLHLGRALRQDNRPSNALAAYRQALKLSPHLTEAQRAADALSLELR
jgi:cytochrome c-type biogenesis protein CcmH/NrfG